MFYNSAIVLRTQAPDHARRETSRKRAGALLLMIITLFVPSPAERSANGQPEDGASGTEDLLAMARKASEITRKAAEATNRKYRSATAGVYQVPLLAAKDEDVSAELRLGLGSAKKSAPNAEDDKLKLVEIPTKNGKVVGEVVPSDDDDIVLVRKLTTEVPYKLAHEPTRIIKGDITGDRVPWKKKLSIEEVRGARMWQIIDEIDKSIESGDPPSLLNALDGVGRMSKRFKADDINPALTERTEKLRAVVRLLPSRFCPVCFGTLLKPCTDCDGKGDRMEQVPCDHNRCKAQGGWNCHVCGGGRWHDCPNCSGSGQVLETWKKDWETGTSSPW